MALCLVGLEEHVGSSFRALQCEVVHPDHLVYMPPVSLRTFVITLMHSDCDLLGCHTSFSSSYQCLLVTSSVGTAF